MYKKLTWMIALSAILIAGCGDDEARNTDEQNQEQNQQNDAQNQLNEEAGPKEDQNEGVQDDDEIAPKEQENEVIGDDQFDMPDSKDYKEDKNLNK
jgi:hypothetical protein